MTTTLTYKINTLIFEPVHKYSPSHRVYKCKIGDLLTHPIQNWCYNRPPDMVRCDELASSIYTKHAQLEWILSMSFDTSKNRFCMIDGIHRLTALQIIKRENTKAPDYITPSLYGNTGDALWLYEMYILCSIRIDPSIGEQIDWFQTLNKSIPVPELYIVDKNIHKRDTVEKIVHSWQELFKTHFTANRKPNIPNTNRDLFIEILSYVYDKYKISVATEHLLEEKIYDLNNYIREHIPIKASEIAVEKCKKTGCYLFLIKNDVLENMV